LEKSFQRDDHEILARVESFLQSQNWIFARPIMRRSMQLKRFYETKVD
jgi:hypothetical protein